jgi:outer membrane protein W
MRKNALLYLILIINLSFSNSMDKIGLVGSINYQEPGLGIKYNINNKFSTEVILSVKYQQHYIDSLSNKITLENFQWYPLLALYYNINKSTKPNIFTGLYFSYVDDDIFQHYLHVGIPIGLEYYIMDKISLFLVSGIDAEYDFQDYNYYSWERGYGKALTIGFTSTRLGIIIYIK